MAQLNQQPPPLHTRLVRNLTPTPEERELLSATIKHPEEVTA